MKVLSTTEHLWRWEGFQKKDLLIIFLLNLNWTDSELGTI